MHRIKYTPGLQRSVNRYNLAILFRPERNASIRSKVGDDDAEEGDLTAWEWEVKKAMSLARDGASVQSQGGKPPIVDT